MRWLGKAVLPALLAPLVLFAQEPESRVPDLTRGGTPDKCHDWTLGPTGARGWICGHGLETTDARQILVTKVEKGSPADGKLEVKDVILGLEGKRFECDARRAFGEAIAEAESKGALRLTRWREGKEEEVTLPLKVMRGYADTAPYSCAKSEAILDGACRFLAARELEADIAGEINALTLLASGRPEYLEKVRALAHEVGPPELKLKLELGMHAWEWGFHAIFLGEYFLATGDKAVLPAIAEYARMIAAGQSAVGTWGHGMALPGNEGRLSGYGAVNSAGLGCWLGLVLAQKCGVVDPKVKRAIEASQRFFGFYVNKGSIPYGDHPPYWEMHDNNGKNGFAAIAFDLLEDAPAVRFFARMSTAAYDEREAGHTGNYFGYLWGPLGVARVGPGAVAAHLKEQRWYYDLARRWDGSFAYQGGAGEEDSYDDMDMTGVFALTYALPLRKLFITGRGASAANELSEKDVRAAIADGRDFGYRRMEDCFDGKGAEELLAGLSSGSPTVRFRSARSLARKQGDFVPKLISLLGSDEPNARYGACEALEKFRGGAAPAVDELIKLLTHDDPWLQIRASYALAAMGAPGRKAVPALLKLALAETKDPRRMVARYLCLALFPGDGDEGARGLLDDSLDGVDRQLLRPAIRELLTLDDGLARARIASVYARLTEEDLDELWPDILRAVERPAPSGEMFADEVRLAGLKLLAKHRIEEGMRAAVEYAKNQNPWSSEERMGEILKTLKAYGANAKVVLPDLRELVTLCQEEKDFPDDCKKQKTAAVEKAIRFVEAATKKVEVRSITQRKQR